MQEVSSKLRKALFNKMKRYLNDKIIECEALYGFHLRRKKHLKDQLKKLFQENKDLMAKKK